MLTKCGECGRISIESELEQHTERGASEYWGGPQVEPDEVVDICPHCRSGVEGWYDLEDDEEILEYIDDLIEDNELTYERLVNTQRDAKKSEALCEELKARIAKLEACYEPDNMGYTHLKMKRYFEASE
jgi:hypothetical protein